MRHWWQRWLGRRGATVCGLVIILLTTASTEARAQALLDVPYLAQTPELCGGAAVSMVLRYWGEQDVFPQDFAALVDADARGIPTGTLAAAVRARGWQAQVLPAPSLDSVRHDIDRGRPVIALIEVAPDTYHFVVIVGVTQDQVVLHDPARAPFQTTDRVSFERAWEPTNRWALRILPGAERPVAPAATPPDASPAAVDRDKTPQPPSACQALVDRSVTLASEGRTVDAEHGLLAAITLCPDDASGWSELAGVRFTQSRWTDAADLAAHAVHLAPDDEYALRLLATSRYLAGNLVGALRPWNALGEPRIDVVSVLGDTRSSHSSLVAETGLKPRQLLTPNTFRRATERVRTVPSLSTATIRYIPGDDQRAQVQVAVVDRAVVPTGWIPLGVLAGRAAIRQAAHVEIAGAAHAGERLTTSWRWRDARPRARLELAFPAPGQLPGVVSFVAEGERQTYASATPLTSPTERHSRRRFLLGWSDWASGWLRWQAAAGRDRFDRESFVVVRTGVDFRMLKDRVFVKTTVAHWIPVDAASAFSTIEAEVSTHLSGTDGGGLTAVGAFRAASQHAPLAVWPGADSGAARQALLRAHPLLDHDIVTGEVFGRRVGNATLTYTHAIRRVLGHGVGAAVFVDAAQAWQRRVWPARSRVFVDAGFGLRVTPPGSTTRIRVDLAHGLRGGGAVVSAGIEWSSGGS